MKPDFQEPVNLNWQSVLVIMPLIWLWALSRIKKLRRGLLIFISLNFVLSTIAILVIDSASFLVDDLAAAMFVLLGFGIYGLMIFIQIKLIRKWSREWNKQFKTSSRGESQHK